MLDRISLMILMSSSLPWDAIKRLVASALDINIHLTRLPEWKRIVQEISAYKRISKSAVSA